MISSDEVPSRELLSSRERCSSSSSGFGSTGMGCMSASIILRYKASSWSFGFNHVEFVVFPEGVEGRGHGCSCSESCRNIFVGPPYISFIYDGSLR